MRANSYLTARDLKDGVLHAKTAEERKQWGQGEETGGDLEAALIGWRLGIVGLSLARGDRQRPCPVREDVGSAGEMQNSSAQLAMCLRKIPARPGQIHQPRREFPVSVEKIAGSSGEVADGIWRRAGGICRHADGVCRRANSVCRRANSVCRCADSVCRCADSICRRADSVCRRANGVCRRADSICARAEGVCRRADSVCCRANSVCRRSDSICARAGGVCGRADRACHLPGRRWTMRFAHNCRASVSDVTSPTASKRRPTAQRLPQTTPTLLNAGRDGFSLLSHSYD